MTKTSDFQKTKMQSLVHCMESQKWYSDFGLARAVAWCESNWKCVVIIKRRKLRGKRVFTLK